MDQNELDKNVMITGEQLLALRNRIISRMTALTVKYGAIKTFDIQCDPIYQEGVDWLDPDCPKHVENFYVAIEWYERVMRRMTKIVLA